ncbi:hypothetical protein [Occultella kanbiaonis]|nr:hypothetical protein [Occultella kanbiaonis]
MVRQENTGWRVGERAMPSPPTASPYGDDDAAVRILAATWHLVRS